MKTELRWLKHKIPYDASDEVHVVLQYRTCDPEQCLASLAAGQTIDEANEACWSKWKDVPTVWKDSHE